MACLILLPGILEVEECQIEYSRHYMIIQYLISSYTLYLEKGIF